MSARARASPGWLARSWPRRHRSAARQLAARQLEARRSGAEVCPPCGDPLGRGQSKPSCPVYALVGARPAMMVVRRARLEPVSLRARQTMTMDRLRVRVIRSGCTNPSHPVGVTNSVRVPVSAASPSSARTRGRYRKGLVPSASTRWRYPSGATVEHLDRVREHLDVLQAACRESVA